MMNSSKDPANAPEVIDNPDYSRYPEVHEQAAPSAPKYDVYQPPQPQYAAGPVAMSDGYGSPHGSLQPQQSWAPDAGAVPSKEAVVEDKPARLFGLRRRNAFLLIAAVVIAIIALAVGLGAGLTVGKNHNSDSNSAVDAITTGPSSTPTVAPDNSTATSSPTSSASGTYQTVSAVNCNDIQNNTLATASSNSTSRYRVLCAVHWLTGKPGLDGNGTVHDVGRNDIVASTFEQCLGYCDDYNKSLNQTVDPTVPGSGCLAVTFNGQYQQSIGTFGRNCFLKDRQGIYDDAKSTTESGVLIST